MTVADSVDQASAAFADIVCSDPEWVAAEFAEIVAGLSDPAPTRTASSGPRIAQGSRRRVTLRYPAASWWADVLRTIRSPPHRPGRPA